MQTADDMKRITEEMVSSYESRIVNVAMIIDNTHKIIENFRIIRNEMSNHLKERLAKEDTLRKKDFDNMMRNVLLMQDRREEEVRDLLKTFLEELKEMAEIIKKQLADGNKVRIEDFKSLLDSIRTRQTQRGNEVDIMLKEFHEEYTEMTKSLNELLRKGEAVRIQDLKSILKNIHNKQMNRSKEVREKLDEFRKQREETELKWKNIFVNDAHIRAIN
ncbi:MAG: hypothetical protein RAP70_01305 [Candidatus Celaenobacter antarcticus]|nr:hypothetical protein [Candidatus Celaenobacter antarcticus]